ncbi:MAG: MIP/aquaporin family protein [Lacunisphaera sp.]
MSAAGYKPMPLPAWFVGEAAGTFLLVFFGCGSVATAVLTGAQVGIFQVSIVWGLATAIYLTGSLSGAHLNPAVTAALAVWTDFPRRRVLGYWSAQFLGAFVASLALYVIYAGVLEIFESAHGIVRGAPGSEASAMIFGEFFPNPGGRPLTAAARIAVPEWRAFFIEALGTGILMLVILGVMDEGNRARSRGHAALIIGLTVTILISLLGPLTQAAFNPARDLAPRLFSALAGWQQIPFTANGRGWFTVYLLAPMLGAVAAGGIHRRCFAPRYRVCDCRARNDLPGRPGGCFVRRST